MSKEVWREDYERYKYGLLDDLDILFEAATLNYLNNEQKMADWLHGERVGDSGDRVLRVAFANWASKRKILIEKPIDGAHDNYVKSIFANEHENIAFSIYITDILQRDLVVGRDFDDTDSIECLQVEIYKDGRIALLYFGHRDEYQQFDSDEDMLTDDEDDIDDDEDAEEENTLVLNGLMLLGIEYSEQGSTTHQNLEKLVRHELDFDYWVDDFRNSLHSMMDGYTQQFSENENKK